MISIPIVSNFNDKGIKTAIREFKQLETVGQKAQFAIKKAAVPAGLAVAAFGTFLVAATKGAEQARIADQKLASVLNTMGYDKAAQRVSAYAESLEKTIAVDADVIKATQTKLATFGQLTKSVGEAGGAFDRATKAALDLASAGFGTAEGNAVQLGKALQDPVKGLASLAKAGVTFTAQEKENIKALVESGKQLEAQELILKAIENQVGGTAEASASSFDKMKFSIASVSDTFGDMMLPVIDALAPKLAEFSAWATENPELLKIAGIAFTVLAGSILAVNAAMMLNPAVLITAGIVALGIAIVAAYKKFEGFRTVVRVVVNSIAGYIEGMVNGFIKAINLVIYGINLVKPGKDIDPLGEIKLGRIAEPVEPADLGRNGSANIAERNNNITMNVYGGDPNQVVEALRSYMRQNGSVPIKVSNIF
jgi:phage-related minor tail protein